MCNRGKLVAWLSVLIVVLMPVTAGATLMCGSFGPPPGMVVIGSGNAPVCEGLCQARVVEPVHGEVMTICSGQRIPDGYEVVASETVSACECLGHTDNAYVIRRQR
jgi:hypothetical protein